MRKLSATASGMLLDDGGKRLKSCGRQNSYKSPSSAFFFQGTSDVSMFMQSQDAFNAEHLNKSFSHVFN